MDSIPTYALLSVDQNQRSPMTEDDPVYLTKRMMTEQEYARRASCSETAAVHQNLAEAYRLRLAMLNQGHDRGES